MASRQLVHIVDDDTAVLHATAFMLRHAGFQVMEFESGPAFLKIAKTTDRGCVLLDMGMAEMDGMEVQREMVERDIDMPVIILTGHGDIETAVQAMRLGAVNFLEKPYEKEFLLEALEDAFAFHENKDLRFMAASQAQARLASLSGPEQDVLEELMNGCSNKTIASNLGISLQSVEIFRANLMDKLRVRNIAQAIRLGFAASDDSVPASPVKKRSQPAEAVRQPTIRRSAPERSSGHRPRAT
jgi:two-component system response regulator FixJ